MYVKECFSEQACKETVTLFFTRMSIALFGLHELSTTLVRVSPLATLLVTS